MTFIIQTYIYKTITDNLKTNVKVHTTNLIVSTVLFLIFRRTRSLIFHKINFYYPNYSIPTNLNLKPNIKYNVNTGKINKLRIYVFK